MCFYTYIIPPSLVCLLLTWLILLSYHKGPFAFCRIRIAVLRARLRNYCIRKKSQRGSWTISRHAYAKETSTLIDEAVQGTFLSDQKLPHLIGILHRSAAIALIDDQLIHGPVFMTTIWHIPTDDDGNLSFTELLFCDFQWICFPV